MTAGTLNGQLALHPERWIFPPRVLTRACMAPGNHSAFDLGSTNVHRKLGCFRDVTQPLWARGIGFLPDDNCFDHAVYSLPLTSS
jgi:hypothetical protein